jgi:PIN domain nuclease of toxin-antitoxin system
VKVLLDTHTWIWWLFDPARVSSVAQDALVNADARFFSAVSGWELSIKMHLQKLSLPQPLNRILGQLSEQNIAWLDVSPEHCAHLQTLPFHHKDPFDRMLVAQAVVEGLVLVSNDQALHPYPGQRLW